MSRKQFGRVIGIAGLACGLLILGDRSLAFAESSGGSCCHDQLCLSSITTHCTMDPCPVNWVCCGDGGCGPNWALAWCAQSGPECEQ